MRRGAGSWGSSALAGRVIGRQTMGIAVLWRQKLLVRDIEIRWAAQEPKLSRAASGLGRWLKCQIACGLLRCGWMYMRYGKVCRRAQKLKGAKRSRVSSHTCA